MKAYDPTSSIITIRCLSYLFDLHGFWQVKDPEQPDSLAIKSQLVAEVAISVSFSCYGDGVCSDDSLGGTNKPVSLK